MIQIATVERILESGGAEISVMRQSACAHDCGSCAGCGVTGQAVRTRAANPIGALPGQKVIVRSGGKQLLKIAAVVYLLPAALFLAGYIAAALLTSHTAVQYVGAAGGFVLGTLCAVAYDRHLRTRGGLAFTIVRLV